MMLHDALYHRTLVALFSHEKVAPKHMRLDIHIAKEPDHIAKFFWFPLGVIRSMNVIENVIIGEREHACSQPRGS